jgi:hypothetical protein
MPLQIGGIQIGFCITPGNTHNRKPVDELLKDLSGKVFAE